LRFRLNRRKYIRAHPTLREPPPAIHGGATCVYPGSHRQVFNHWAERGEAPAGSSALLPDIEFNDPVPIPGKAGDVILMHYLLVHAGSANHSDQIRFALNTGVHPDPANPYQRRTGPPTPEWTPLDYTLAGTS